MSSAWNILGLVIGQRDERSIKRAYAKLLKQHRPDQDPEGFRRIHDAYQVVGWLSGHLVKQPELFSVWRAECRDR